MPDKKKIRVLIVDESVLCRDLLRAALAEATDIEVIGAAPTAKTGMDRIANENPDLVLLSATIPDTEAEEITRWALEKKPVLGIVVTARTDAETIDKVVLALEAGAFDFVEKPEDECPESYQEVIGRRLLPKIRSFSAAVYSRVARKLSQTRIEAPTEEASQEGLLRRVSRSLLPKRSYRPPSGRPELIVIGVSTGGPEALSRLIPALPGNCPVPIVVAIHMPERFTASLAVSLNDRSQLTVKEAGNRERMAAGHVYIARGGKHLVFERADSTSLVLRTNDDSPENGCKPSVDVMFRSAARVTKSNTMALLLTGMGLDGVKGMERLKNAGAYTLAQDKASSVVWGMPGAAVQAGVVDEVLSLDKLIERIRERVR
jgi:two-component system chemotaxis response regulator CheB